MATVDPAVSTLIGVFLGGGIATGTGGRSCPPPAPRPARPRARGPSARSPLRTPLRDSSRVYHRGADRLLERLTLRALKGVRDVPRDLSTVASL
jgi:hypothetical protein